LADMLLTEAGKKLLEEIDSDPHVVMNM